MGTLRTKEMEDKYEEYKKQRDPNASCDLCAKEAIQTFKYWKITECMFPWDKLVQVQHMIMPIRHITDLGLSAEERQELEQIKYEYLHERYELIAEATNKKKSIPAHWHLHLIISKE